MAKRAQTLRYTFTEGVIRLPDISRDVGANRYSFLMTALDFFKEIAEGNGSKRITEGENTYWEARFAEHEAVVTDHWLTRHAQYERVESLEELFVVPVDTGPA